MFWAAWCLQGGNFLPAGITAAIVEASVVKLLIWIGPAIPFFLRSDEQWYIQPVLMFKNPFPGLPTLIGACFATAFLHTVRISSVGINVWGSLTPTLIILSLSAAVVEELAFRGFYFNRQATTIGTQKAAILNGMLFALYHFPEFLAGRNFDAILGFRFWMIVAVGCIFSLAFAKWKHLGMTIIIHFSWNLLSYIFGTA